MHVLVTNDDGVFAPGILCLAQALHEAGYRVTVIAPDRERSSVGHAVTLSRPLRLWPTSNNPFPEEVRSYACDGTPSDCVVLGVEEMAPEVSFVLSGINCGPNLGDDLTYSGTVSAAMEGVILGKDAIAVSLDCRVLDAKIHYETAASITVSLLGWLEHHPLPKGVLLNVNVPNLPFSRLKGLQVTRKGVRVYEGKVTRFEDPHGRTYFWVAGRPEDELVEGTDVWAVAHGYVSLTPLHLDLTHYPTLEAFKKSDLEKTFLAELQFGEEG